MSIRLKLFLNIFLLLFLQFNFLKKINAQESCTPLIKQTRYSIQSDEDFFSVLKNFRLEPVIGDGGSLEILQKLNSMTGQTTAQAGTEVIIPFKCEEQLIGWRVIDRGSYRLITSELIDKNNTGTSKIKTESLTTDEKTLDILNKDIPGEALNEILGAEPSADISEALRYRMICEGEWTGTECVTRYSTVSILGSAWYNRYDGVDRTTGGHGILLSRLNPEVGVGWSNYWSANFRTDLQVSVIKNAIHPEIRERPIVQDKNTLSSFSFDVRYEMGKWGVNLGLSQREKLFYRFLTENIVLFDDGGVIVNAVPLMDIHTSVSYMIRQAGKYRVDGVFGLASIQGGGTSGYNVNPGTAFSLACTVQHDRVQEYLFGTIKYEVSQQDTDILLQKASELGFAFGYAWKLKDW